jgi:hypothetical protein
VPGQWVFDDPLRAIVRQPFFAGPDQVLDLERLGVESGDVEFRLLFSPAEIPGSMFHLKLVSQTDSGPVYRCDELNREGTLWASLQRYLRESPPELFVKVEHIEGRPISPRFR